MQTVESSLTFPLMFIIIMLLMFLICKFCLASYIDSIPVVHFPFYSPSIVSILLILDLTPFCDHIWVIIEVISHYKGKVHCIVHTNKLKKTNIDISFPRIIIHFRGEAPHLPTHPHITPVDKALSGDCDHQFSTPYRLVLCFMQFPTYRFSWTLLLNLPLPCTSW